MGSVPPLGTIWIDPYDVDAVRTLARLTAVHLRLDLLARGFGLE